eukprot:gene4095-2942_t
MPTNRSVWAQERSHLFPIPMKRSNQQGNKYKARKRSRNTHQILRSHNTNDNSTLTQLSFVGGSTPQKGQKNINNRRNFSCVPWIDQACGAAYTVWVSTDPNAAFWHQVVRVMDITQKLSQLS